MGHPKNRQYLDIDSKSVMANDIQAIWHDPSSKAICVALEKTSAKCPHPEFIGRLSGPSLVMLEWKEYFGNNNNNTIHHCGSYSKNAGLVLVNNDNDNDDTTQYYVEILILYCQKFGVGSQLYQKKKKESQQLSPQSTTPFQQQQANSNNEWLYFDFSNMCVEPPEANRITEVGASIEIMVASTPKHNNKNGQTEKMGIVYNDGDSILQEGRWIKSSTTLRKAEKLFLPLKTRYQPQGCRSSPNNITTANDTLYCKEATDMTRFDDYNFEWDKQGQEEFMKKAIEKLQWDIGSTRKQVCGNELLTSDQKRECVLRLGQKLQNNTLVKNLPSQEASKSSNVFQTPAPMPPLSHSKVCVVGYSHSYHMIHAMHQLHLGHHFVWAQAKYPADIDFHFVRRHIQDSKCRQFLIGVGQWPASHWGNHQNLANHWPEGKPVSFGVYRNEIFRVLDMFHNYFSNIPVYMRSIHYNPIMEDSGKCLPGDWRTPTVMTAYSEIIREQVHNLNERILKAQTGKNQKDHAHIQFLDTRFITYPMWDSSYDWYHLSDQVAEVEALYVATAILDNKLSKRLSLEASSKDQH